ncbi:MAG: hypothetical protein SFX73_35295 [Kofleriaceae bacterium]|nr:hypothetical protein [Kofleriaceae bacterium]
MPSRLSSLLVRDGLIGVKRMEKAFQRQVIYGGSLDTILLEMSLIPEERLTQYLALASGLPPASRDEGTSLSPAAIATIPRDIAERYRAVPVALDGECVRVLVCSPLEINELEDLADQLDRPLQPLITPEFRWHLVYAAAYRLDPPARYTTLARALDVEVTSTPVGRTRTIIVETNPPPRPVHDDEAAPDTVVTDVTERTPTLADLTTRLPSTLKPPATADGGPSTQPLPPANRLPATPSAQPPIKRAPTAEASAPTELQLPAAGSLPPRKAPSAPPANESGANRKPTLIGMKAPIIIEGGPIAAATPPTGVPTPIAEPPKRSRGQMRPLRGAGTQPISTEGRDGPLTVVAARELLAAADDRDTVFLTVLRAARSRTRWAGLLTVQGGAAIGRVAIADAGIDTTAINTVLIPLDAVSAFRTVVSSHQPHVGPIISGDPGIDAMALRLGGTMPPSALLLPLVLRDRVVALVVAHRVNAELRMEEVTELYPIAHAASEAIGRLIVRHKSAGYRAPVDNSAVEVEIDRVDTKKFNAVREDGTPWTAPERVSIPNIDQGVEVPIPAEPTRPIDAVLDEIEGSREGFADDAMREAVERAMEAMGPLNKRFPGQLRVQRFAVTGRPLRAAQYGGLLELVIRLGSVASELLIEKMASQDRDVRFFATVCTAELRPRTAVFALAERLFDQDFGVRASAIEALAGYPIADINSALARARRAVHSSDPEVVAAAAVALTELGDVEAVPDLIGVIERSDRAGDQARRALVRLTAQDFGSSERKWRKWYTDARERHRIEWLIDGLVHKDDAIRENAITDLRRLTGEYFGYHHDLPRKERDAAAARWAAWWRETGERRFKIREDERHRPTAQLPVRREPT